MLQYLADESNVVLQLRTLPCKSGTLARHLLLRQPVQESNLVPRLRKPLCAPKHLRATSIPTWIRTRTRTFGGSDAILYTIGIQFIPRANDWIRTLSLIHI